MPRAARVVYVVAMEHDRDRDGASAEPFDPLAAFNPPPPTEREAVDPGPCMERWMGRRCKLRAGHEFVCQYEILD